MKKLKNQKFNKRLLSVSLALAMLIMIMPVSTAHVYAANTFTFEYASSVGWGENANLNLQIEDLKKNGVGGDKITIISRLVSKNIYIYLSGGPDNDPVWSGSGLTQTPLGPESSKDLTIPTNYVVDNVNLTDYAFECKIKPAHTHNFTYSASGAKLTATSTCHTVKECDYNEIAPKTVELTLTAGDANYSGYTVTFGDSTVASNSLKIEGYNTWSTTVGKAPKVEFSNDNGSTWSASAPSAKGNYIMRVYPDEAIPSNTNTAKVNFEIKDHNFTKATSTMIGITLDIPTTSSTAIAGVMADKNIAVLGSIQNNDMIVFGIKDSKYQVGIYSEDEGKWSNELGYAYEKSLAEIKAHITAGYRVYVIGTVQEPHSWSYQATGNTVTAICDQKCPEKTTHTATLTLTASSANYSGW